MARKSNSTILQEELYPPAGEHSRVEASRSDFPHDDPMRVELDDARLVDLDVNEESPFLRGQKRVSARRSALPKKAAHGLLWASAAAAILCVAALAAAALYHYGERSWRFRVESSDNIEVVGTNSVSKAQIMEVMGADIGRNIFFVPLAEQQAQLEQIPWVESASVMRFVPNRLRVEIHERVPVAFARVGPRIELIDAGGTLMELPKTQHNQKYSFPVILGMNPGEPLSTRAPRMKAYAELVRDLDSGGARYSQDLSEVDLSDLDDLKVRVNDPAGDVLVHLGSSDYGSSDYGSSDYLKRYKIYVSHAQEWRQQFQKLESVNLRYDNQVIVNPDMENAPRKAQLALAAAKAAASAGVKPAALITKVAPNDKVKALPKPAFELSKATLDEAAGKKPAVTKPAKGKAKSKTNTVAHPKNTAAQKKAAQKTALQKNAVQKNAPKQIAKTSGAPMAPATTKASAKAEDKKPAQSAPAAAPKPSPAIAKPSAAESN
jgi:cell division protein FtsQ